MRRVSLSPASASPSSGSPTPTANPRVSTSAPTLNCPDAPTTEMTASTGPAQGTNNRPSPSPSMKPLLSGLTCLPGSRANGFSIRSPSWGKTKLNPTTSKTMMPTLRSRSAGRCRALSSSVPNRVVRLKPTVSPAITP